MKITISGKYNIFTWQVADEEIDLISMIRWVLDLYSGFTKTNLKMFTKYTWENWIILSCLSEIISIWIFKNIKTYRKYFYK